VAYLRAEQESGVPTTIVMAKSKITPMKSQTTPRLELSASLVAARLSHFISEKLKPKLGQTGITLWSDSEIVLHWLCSKKLPDSFVLRRIEEINRRTTISGDIALLHLILLICLAVELLLAPWLMNAAFGGSGLFGAVPEIMWNMRFTRKA